MDVEASRSLPGSDADLAKRAAAGDGRAFARLIERHHAMAAAVVRGVLGDRDDTEDVLQEVYIAAYRGLPRFRGDSLFGTWLYQVARNTALNAARRRRVDTTPVDEVHLEADEQSSPGAVLARRDAKDRVARALGEIEMRYREVIELRYMAERTYEEIAELTGLPKGTVKTFVHRGKVQLREQLLRQETGERLGGGRATQEGPSE